VAPTPACFRDAIRRWLQIHAAGLAPSSCTARATAAALRRCCAPTQEAALAGGLVLQSPALDYNSNCGVSEANDIPCTGYCQLRRHCRLGTV